MENAKQLIMGIDKIAKVCEEIRLVCEVVISPETLREIDPEAEFARLLRAIVQQSTDAREKWAQSCGLTLDAPVAVKSPELREYHIQEFFKNLVYDENGEIIDQNAYYCDQYHMNYLLSRLFRRGKCAAVEYAQEVIIAFQNGSASWDENLSVMALELFQPILNNVEVLSPMLHELAIWHNTLARQNIDAYKPA